jgi:arylformamidase
MLIDLSHRIEHGMVTYKGLPAPHICDYWEREASAANYDDGSTFQIGRIDMVANTGTYLDTPFHRYEEGDDLAAVGLDRLAGLDGLCVRAGGMEAGAGLFEGLDVAGKAVLVHTGWDRHWTTEAYFEGHPYLMEDAAVALVDRGAVFVGIDSLNIDDTADLRRPVHTTLLGNDIPIGEHLCGLAGLPVSGARFFAVPVKVKGFGTFPVRAFARV